MNAKERGFLLLTSQLGDPERKPMTVAQFRTLASRAVRMEKPAQLRDMTERDLTELGYSRQEASRILCLLEEADRLDAYLSRGRTQACVPVSRVSAAYPAAVRQRLGQDAPGCLWAKGDLSLLETQTVALVGCRELKEPNRIFAEKVGREAARQGITLVSGNARGADKTAQTACLAHGGKLICVVADELQKYPSQENVLYLSEDGFDQKFVGYRALSRNRVIHTLGYITVVAQCGMGAGGTWDGTVKNLQHGWSPVFCFDDGSPAAAELEQRGAALIGPEALENFPALCGDTLRLF